MPAEPNFLERLLRFRSEKGPAPVLDLFGAAGFRAVALALDLGLFETLEGGARTPADLADALAPGGRVAVLDQSTGSARTPVGEAGLGFVGLTYLTTLGAEIHSYDDVAAWLREAGFEDVRKASIRRAGPGNALVQATKRGETVPVE